jgi:agmatinase
MSKDDTLWGTELQECFGPPNNFLGLDSPEADFPSARAVILPVPYDGTTTFKAGTREGPRAIIQASRELEFYDEETCSEAYKQGIATLDELAVTVASPREMVERVRKVGEWMLAANKLPVLLGGEHLVSLGMIQALAARYPDFTILHFDAHSDLREEYQGSGYSNACIMRRAVEHTSSLVQVGIRALTKAEHDFIRDRKIPCYFAYRLRQSPELWDRIVDDLGSHVYISVDLDAFDPSIMPSVGTPEPGGLEWYEVLRLLRRVVQKSRIIGFDVMELAPSPANPAPDLMAARLVYKLLTYIFLDNPKAA